MKISVSFRAFVFYFMVIGTLSWFILDKAIEKLETAFQQSSETVLIDTANLLATFLEHDFSNQVLDTAEMSRVFEDSYKRQLNAQIYSLFKQQIDLEIYVTNRKGIVVYDSTNQHEGADFSAWRDVNLTLKGQYGARSSYRYAEQTNKGDEKVMVVAAPIRINNDIVGVLSIIKPVRPLEQLLATESTSLKIYALLVIAVAMVLGYFVSHGFTVSISRLVNYAKSMATGEKVSPPKFMDKRLDNLAEAINYMREQIDGKEYVEHYIHGLTHELKTPLTAVGAAAELLSEDLPKTEQQRFINNIRVSNQRMQKLVERMLDLAKIESQHALDNIASFNLYEVVRQLLTERSPFIAEFQLQIKLSIPKNSTATGDKLLIRQAIANLIDNALENCHQNGNIKLAYQQTESSHHFSVSNDGEPLDDYVIERAFERFFSLQSKNRLRKSTGLGLSFVREIMQLHQGKAYLKNTDKGVVAGIEWALIVIE